MLWLSWDDEDMSTEARKSEYVTKLTARGLFRPYFPYDAWPKGKERRKN